MTVRLMPRPAVFAWNGTRFDLSWGWADVEGGVWTWTGRRNDRGEPIMRDRTDGPELPLPDLWHRKGPLLAQAPPGRPNYMRGAA